MYSELVPKDLYEDIIKYPIEKIRQYCNPLSQCYQEEKGECVKSPYNIKCFQQFIDCLKEREIAEELKKILLLSPKSAMELDDTLWDKDYYETPCHVVTTPESFLYQATKKEVDYALEYLICQQGDDGIWHLTWRFGKEEIFRDIERKYELQYTLNYLVELKRFRLIELGG